jgi:hypothetical protein
LCFRHLQLSELVQNNRSKEKVESVVTDEFNVDEYNAACPPECAPVALSGGTVKDRSKFLTIFAALLLSGLACAQTPPKTDPTTIFCTYEDGNEVSLRYVAVDANRKNDPPGGKPWMPGGAPVLLFTPTEIVIGNTTIPTGAYSVYPIRNRNDWTLVVNKNVAMGSGYDEQKDLVRVNMETSKLASGGSKPLSLTLGHTSAKVCSLQLVYADSAAWTDLKQK